MRLISIPGLFLILTLGRTYLPTKLAVVRYLYFRGSLCEHKIDRIALYISSEYYGTRHIPAMGVTLYNTYKTYKSRVRTGVAQWIKSGH